MTINSGESSHCEAQSRADTRESITPANKPEWGDISRQCLSDNSIWHAARGGTGGLDPTLDKTALASGSLQFGSINDLIGKSPKSGEPVANARPAETVGSPVGAPGAGSDKTAQAKAATLFSKDATDEQKLATVRELVGKGITDMTYRDSAGADHKLRLEVEAAGSRQMVHLFTSGADGRERTALRGISRADGTFEQERDRRGNFVDFKGRGYSQLNPEGSEVPTPTRPSQRERPRIPGDSNRWNGLPDDPTGRMDRSQFDAQLRDPRVMAAFAGRMASEVGTQGPAAQLAFAEEVMNRAASRNQTLMQALTGRYYPTHNPGRSNNPAYVAAITKAWQEGTDITRGATGNASGRVGFGVPGGHYDANHQWVSPNQTVRINGERFGYEQVDLNRGWLEKYRQLKRSS